jgi:broad specificity phosphatase PhoE
MNLENPTIVSNSIEKEKGPKPVLVVDFVRHGDTTYKEFDAMDGSPYEVDLTNEGIRKVEEYADQLVERVKPDETVVFWVSPAWRTITTKEVIEKKLQEKGIPVYKDSVIKLLRPMDQYDKEKMGGIWDELEASGDDQGHFVATHESMKDKNEVVEGYTSSARRGQRVLSYLNYVANNIADKDKKMRIICIGHFEVLQDILTKQFDKSIDDTSTYINKGEGYEITFSKVGEEIKVSGSYRGENIDDIKI